MDKKPHVLLPSTYLAPVSHYALMYHAAHCTTEVCDHYQKQTLRNRCIIASPNGPLSLTIPVVKPSAPHTEMRDIRISDHGNWRHLHWNALQSSYNASPFFEYYADDLAPFYERKWEFLVDFNEALQSTICQLINFQPHVSRTTAYEAAPTTLLDCRPMAATDATAHINFSMPPYYQVFAQRHGFMPNLSIIDLLCNMGPESLIYLDHMDLKQAE